MSNCIGTSVIYKSRDPCLILVHDLYQCVSQIFSGRSFSLNYIRFVLIQSPFFLNGKKLSEISLVEETGHFEFFAVFAGQVLKKVTLKHTFEQQIC